MSVDTQQLRVALATKHAHAVAAAIDLPPVKPGGGKYKGSASTARLSVDGSDYSNVLSALIDATNAAEAGDAISCFDAQSRLHSALNHNFGSSSGNWLVPALQIACRNTHQLAVAADAAASLRGGGRNDHSRLQNAVTLLQESFSKTLNDRREFDPRAPLDENGSKKAGVLFIVNQLFAMYFRLNTLRLCKNLVRPVESRNLNKSGKMGEMVTYRYFVGRLNMFEDQYEDAETNLDYALQHCRRDAINNKRLILSYLVPVKLLRGRLPTTHLLQKYGLNEFVPLVEGIRTGDLRTFNDGLLRYQNLFIRRGTYLLLEKCKTVCYRNLFKRVHLILGKSQIHLDSVAKSFKWLGMTIDLDEVECILANLIFRGYIRGYISHSKRILVLSKKDPFPKSAIIASR
mmetsp:Transcript_19559/g.42193  ORF Transcript_19559/g.42193 Transcript_19559/m.42193 type:complete len:402 (+) Transcript_19559:100-1305(+)